MSVDVFSLNCASLTDARLVGFKGTERIGRPYELQLYLTVPAGTDVRAAVGTRATLTADRGQDGEPMCWHGVLARMRMLRHVAERVLYRATLVPKLWTLRHSVRSCVHTKEGIKKFITDTLQHGGLGEGDYRFHVDEGRYPEEEFVCQYRESHLDFVHRWLELEGLYYYFEHPIDDAGQEVMVIVDDRGQHQPLWGDGRVRYYPSGGGDVSAGEGLHELSADYSTLPASVLVTDYNYENPAAPVEGEKAVSAEGAGQVRDYGYRVFDEGEARRLAEVKAQSLACRELVVQVAGNALGLRAGYRFEIDDLGAEELPTEYLAIEVVHAGSLAGMTAELAAYTGLRGDETYAVEARAIAADVQYRSEQRTPWPRIYGFENALIDGSADSEYAQLDDHGRYLVRFKFDASTLADGSASTYLRMAQPHGGASEGFHFPLRKGTEVMIAFQGGDPDRPVISGVVPNAQRPSTVTSANHTHNVLRTGGGNFIDMDDLAEQQYIRIHTPKEATVHMGGQHMVGFLGYDQAGEPELVETDYHLYSTGPAGFTVESSWWEDISGPKNVHVHGAVTIGYDSTHKLEIKGKSDEFYNDVRNTEIASGRTDKVKAGGMTQEIQGGLTQTIEPGGRQHVKGGWTHEVDDQNHDKYGTWKTETSTWEGTFTGAVTLDAEGQTVELTAAHVHILSDDVTIDGAQVKTKSSGYYKGWTPYELKTFGTSTAIGIHKTTIAAIKADYTHLALGRTAMKVDSTGIKIDHNTLGVKKLGAGQEIKDVSVLQGGARALTFGILKL
ncbi:MAG: type VI secretion system tip protein VgrG [Deltaproteobacteria bacterium]|jgi:type VI secretion system secreted protein VgrG|nr:type VI secretion system tip protein VgrG [Deltaproteobacteria bacterium]MBW2535832.1 type VI secretion system tip protein VgrG [Deltaproteobacteria bacterium]